MALAGVLVLGCGGGDVPPTPAAPPLRVGTLAPPAGPDDVVVARVNGRPVWGSCVAAQARAHTLDRRAALAECIDLEVAAQEAERRGLERDPDVEDETERALVARFVDREFTAHHQRVADLPAPYVAAVMQKNDWRLERDEFRGSFYGRVDAPDETVPRGSAADQAAEKIAREAYASLAGRVDLFPVDVERALRAAAGPAVKVTFSPFKMTHGLDVQKYYRDALFSIPVVGACAPPVRGPYGWDLVLWTSRLEPLKQTRDEVLAQLWKPMRQRYFLDWAQAAARGHRIETTPPAEVERLLGGDLAVAPAARGPARPPR